MNTQQTLIISSILGGTFLVPFVEYVTQKITNSRVIFSIALGSSILLGTGVAFFEGKLIKGDVNTICESLAFVFITSQTVYNLYWKDSLMREKMNQRVASSNAVGISDVLPIADTGTPEPQQPLNRE